MKTILRNIVIILTYLTSIPFLRRLFLTKPLLRVWCLHEVKDSQIGELEKKIQYLQKEYNIITPTQFKDRELFKDKVNVLITFDDGFESWFTNVLPVLAKYNLKALFFVNHGFLEKSERLTEQGHSLGGHSYSHKRLTELSGQDLEAEVKRSVMSEFFAYPFGDRRSFNEEVIDQIKQAGFKYAFNILPGFNTEKTNPYLLHRDSLDPDVPDYIFRLWLKGSYDWVKMLF